MELFDNNFEIKKSFIERKNISPLLFSFIILLTVFFLYQVLGGLSTLLILGNDLVSFNPHFLRIILGSSQILFLLIPSLLFSKLMSDSFREIYKIRKISLTLIGVTILCTLSLQEVLQILLLLQEQIPIPESLRPIVNLFKEELESSYKLIAYSKTYFDFSIVVLVIAIIPSIVEELLFRGIIQTNLIKSLGFKKAIIICGIIFGLFHFNPFAVFPLIILGIYLCFIVYRSGSIYTSIVAHFTNNFIAVFSFFTIGSDDLIFKEKNFVLTMDVFPMIFLVFLISLGIFLISFYYFIKLTSNK